MHTAADNAKRPVNLSISVKTIEMAKELGINMSKEIDAWLSAEVKRRYWEKWREDNREAMMEYNKRIAKQGLALAKYRTWGKGLGDGREV